MIINVIYCDLVTAKTGRKGMGRTHTQKKKVGKKETQGGEAKEKKKTALKVVR